MRTNSKHAESVGRCRRAPLGIGLAVLALLLGLSFLAGTAQAKIPRNFFGIDEPFQILPHARDLERMHTGHVGWVHTGLEWSNIEPRRGKFNWSRPDAIIGDLASRGIHVLPYLCGSPSYAAKSSNRPPLGSKSARKGWRAFLRAIVARYGPGGVYWTDPGLYGSQHPGGPVVPVRTWQIWHQPNLRKFFAPVSALRYAKLVKISHRAIRQADPRAKIVLAGLQAYADPTAWHFLNRMYRRKHIARDFDAVALHPFASSVRDQRLALKHTRGALKKHGDRHTRIWVTEMGWGSGPRERYGLNKGLEGQAKYLKKSFRMVLHHRRALHLKRVFWFRWRDPLRSATNVHCAGSISCTSGLFTASGEPKPAWRAFRTFTRR